jgi:hypothetical protein
VCGTVALFKACVEELEKTGKEDFKYLMKDAVADAVRAGSLVRGGSAHCPLYLRSGNGRAFDGWRVFVMVHI